MNKKPVETIMGILVLAVAAFFAYFAYNVSDLQVVKGYDVTAKFLKVGGLTVGSDVRINGIKVGTVIAQNLDNEDYTAEIKMSIAPDIKLPADSTAVIAADGLVGDKFIKIEPGKDKRLLADGDVITKTKDFKQNLDEIAGLMAYEVCRDLPLKPVTIETPVAECHTYELMNDIVLIPILRAGLGLVNGINNLIPTAKVGFIGLYRDEETLLPHEYFAKFPSNLADAVNLVLDPMLATGGSANAAIDMIKKRGAKNIKLVCLVGAPEGLEAVKKQHPDVDIYLAALDDCLNDKGYIVPGLGDAGDRIFGTK